jgi:hypothetical protein
MARRSSQGEVIKDKGPQNLEPRPTRPCYGVGHSGSLCHSMLGYKFGELGSTGGYCFVVTLLYSIFQKYSR